MKKDTKTSFEVEPMANQRTFKDSMEFNHDLFCLDVVEMTRNISWNKKPMWETFPHKHQFHTFDSDGRPQSRSTSALGHYHPMTITQTDGVPQVICGVAHRDVMMKDEDGIYVKRSMPLEGRESHDHPIVYKYSERLRTRKVNSEALLAVSKVIDHQTPKFSSDESSTIKNSGRSGPGVE